MGVHLSRIMREYNEPQPTTAIISQKVPEELEESFQSFQKELTERVQSYVGFIGSELIPPRKGIQDTWVSVFRFDNPDHLRSWMNSEERGEVVRKMDALFPDSPHIQIVAEPPKDHVTVVFSHRIAPGREQEYQSWRKKILQAQQAFEGFLGQDSFDPVEGLTEEWVDIARFSNKEALDRWMESADRKKLLGELKPLVDKVEIKNVGTGLDGWFRAQREDSLVKAPPAWKQAVSVLFALYPTVMLLTYYFNPLFGNIDFPLLMLIGNAASVSVLTWLLMPQVNRFLGFWLYPKKKSRLLDFGVAVGLFGILVLLWQLFILLSPGQS